MANTSLLQVRTSAEDKEKASAILEKLGTNLSEVVNMLIKQIIITEGIPFEVKVSHPVYSAEEAIDEVRETMAFENMYLTEEDVRMLYTYKNGEKYKMEIWDRERLHEAERKLTMLRILELLDKSVRGTFDLRHLQAVHAYMFQDV